MARPKNSFEKTIPQLWKENKDVLQLADYTEKTFTDAMNALKVTNNVRTPGAWKIFKHKVAFTGRERIGAENVITGIKDQDDYSAFRKEVIGWKNKVDYDNFKYDKNSNTYEYTRTIKELNDDGELVEVNAKWIISLVSGTAGSQYWKWTRVR